jgi:hemolysin III
VDVPDSAEQPPRFRGFSHVLAFVAAAPIGLVLVLSSKTGAATVGAAVFAASVTGMLGASSLLHRRRWSPVQRRWITALDHAMIYVLIAGTYTPFALLLLRRGWQMPILMILWSAAVVGTVVKLVRPTAPRWFTAGTCLALGWLSLAIAPQIAAAAGIGGFSLLLAGGLAYTVGALVYVRRRPDPFPRAFGYHEIFHALVVVAVACQYVSVAFFVLPRA